MTDLLDVNNIAWPPTCPRCWDTGNRHEWIGGDTYRDTGEPCDDCENDAVESDDPCLYCGRPAACYSVRTGDKLCPACALMERNEDGHASFVARGDRWVGTLGIGENL